MLNLVAEKSLFYPLKRGEREKIKLSIDVPDTGSTYRKREIK